MVCDIIGPDLRDAAPIERQIHELDLLVNDQVGYAQVWVDFVATTGDVSLQVDRDGTEVLMVGRACDDQERERNGRLEQLSAHLRASGHRSAVISLLWLRGIVADQRPNDPHLTSTTLRRFIASGGRVLLNPDGNLEVGAGIPAAVIETGSFGEWMEAGRAFNQLLRRWRSHPQIKRAVRMLGEPTAHGWITLSGVAA